MSRGVAVKSPERVAEAKAMREQGMLLREIAAHFGAGKSTIDGCGHPTKSASDPDGGCPWGPSPCPDLEAARP